MSNSGTIFLYAEIVSGYIQKIVNIFDFVAKKSGLNYTIKAYDKTQSVLSDNDFLLVPVDELSLSNLRKSEFIQIAKNKLDERKIILLLDEIEHDVLPESLYFHPYLHLHYYLKQENTNEYANDDIQIMLLIADILKYIQRNVNNSISNNFKVYLAPADSHSGQEYLALMRELLLQKIELIPEPFFHPSRSYIKNPDLFYKILSEVKLAVHFISFHNTVGFPEKLNDNLHILKLSSQYCKQNPDKPLQRIIYLTGDESAVDEGCVHAIETLKQDNDILIKGELIQNPIEKFKSIVIEKLNSNNEAIKQVKAEGNLYLLHNSDDKALIGKIIEITKRIGKTIHIANTKVGDNNLLIQHQELMVNCEDVIIIDNKSQQWLKSKMNDIKKAPGWGKKLPFKNKIFITDSHELPKIQGINNFTHVSSNNLESLSQILK